MNRKSLGRGLDSLFSNFEDDTVTDVEVNKTRPAETNNIEPVGEPREIAMNMIDPNLDQPRKNFDETALNELAQSIKSIGVIQPIVLAKRNNRYMIVSGERRWRASKIAGLKTIPAIIKTLTDEEIAQIALIENLQREDLNPIESARAIKNLIELYNMTQDSVAEKIGKSRPAVANTLRLLSLTPEVIALIEKNRLSAGHGKVLVSIEDPAVQLEFANISCDNKITVRELEKYIKQYKQGNGKKTSVIIQSNELKDFSKRLQSIFSTKVSIVGNDNKGRIYINYYSKDDLDRIYSILQDK